MKKTLIKLSLVSFILACLSYCIFWFSEELLIKNALRDIEASSYKTDIYQLTRSVHRSICDPERLSRCSVEFVDPSHKIVFSVPGHTFKKTHLFFVKFKKIKLDIYSDNISLLITQTPSLKHFLLLLLFSSAAISPFLIFILYFLKRKKLEDSERLNQITKQVSHDIRSPLAALKMALEEIDSIPENYRNLIRGSVERINDIANNLLSSSKNKHFENEEEHSVKLIALFIDSLLSEKRMEYRDKIGIQIKSDFSKSYGLFASIDSVDLARVLSNIINNSFEAIDESGSITVGVFEENNKICISIRDNGKGIPESIITRIGNPGFSHGKNNTNSGSGLGIHHAKNIIASLNGSLDISSPMEKGTLVKILLPKAKTPAWFATSISISSNTSILVLDDDINIHKLWSERFTSPIISFTDVDLFSQEISKTKINKNFFCLIDYEIHNQSLTGLDLIESLDISNHSILVTSHYDEKKVQDHALRLGVQIIPKIFTSLVDIKTSQESQTIYDYVFIDNDELLRMTWENRAKKNNLSLLVLESCDHFNKFSNQLNKENTLIYIDSDLGKNQIPGEVFAETLHNEGYKKLFIASGHGPEHFSHLPWLGIASKKCPF